MLLAAFAVWWVSDARKVAPVVNTLEGPRAAFEEQVAAGRRAWKQGHLQAAVQAFAQAVQLRRHLPAAEGYPTVGQVVGWYHQAGLLADASTDSLQEVLQQLEGLDEDELHAVFAKRYRGKSVIFFTEMRRDAAGQYQMQYDLGRPGRPVRLALGDLKLLRQLPLQEPQLMLFGVRLADVQRQPDRAWLIELDPESGLCITDPDAARTCLVGYPEEKVLDLIQRQALWPVPAP